MPLILTVANLRPPKGLEVLARTAEKLHGANASWVCPSPARGRSPRASPPSSPSASWRRACGSSVRRDVPALLAASDIFRLTSNREGVPIAILEAMAAGEPVVATDVGGVRELVVGSGTPVSAAGETGLLAPAGDDRALAAALAALIADPARRAAM